ncbi:hypothetical protein F0562_000590 [Nyssa sinensis]|uniref:Uncharacterized protein n=1 Tax=Nyssa sinensis TaxID=561372 RepID=A0A5J5C1U3_9ASTE|nr:hypothetical protein F0562_000590 [Nyssa sinensis]
MSSAQHNAAQTHGQAQAKKEDWVQSAQNTAKKACDKTADNPEQAQRGKEQSAGFLQQTGEQVMSMAQGAIDGVKNTLGVNNEKSTHGHGHEVNNEKSTHGHGHEAKTEDWVQSAQNTANMACDKMADNPEQAQRGKEQSAGFLQQTGEQVMNMAHGAIDGVKNTLGVNNEKSTHGHGHEVNNEKSTYGHGHGHGVNDKKSTHGHGH